MNPSSSTLPKANTIKSLPQLPRHPTTYANPKSSFAYVILIRPTWHAQRIRHLQPPKANKINPLSLILQTPKTNALATQINQNWSKPSESSSSITCTKNHRLRPFPRPTQLNGFLNPPDTQTKPNAHTDTTNQIHSNSNPHKIPAHPDCLRPRNLHASPNPYQKNTTTHKTSTQSN